MEERKSYFISQNVRSKEAEGWMIEWRLPITSLQKESSVTNRSLVAEEVARCPEGCSESFIHSQTAGLGTGTTMFTLYVRR